MTSPDYIKISRGWDLIAEGAAEIAQAYAALEQPRAGVVPSAPAPAETPVQTISIGQYPIKPQIDAGLGICPIHGKAWTIQPAGVGKNGPYDSFWRCGEKDTNGYCKQKPQKIWRDTHPIREGAAA